MDHSVFYSGDTELQCKNGTYALCRPQFVASLEQAVNKGELLQREADERLKKADLFWKRCEKLPEVQEKLASLVKDQQDKEDAILRGAAAQVKELRGDGKDVKVSVK